MGTEFKYQRIIRAVQGTPWAICPERLCDIMDVLTFKANGGELSQEDIRSYVGEKVAAVSGETRSVGGGIAVLPIRGVISHRIEMIDEMSGPGGTSIEKLTTRFRNAMSDPSVGTVLFDIDSPGGSVAGVPELAAEIFDARKQKRIVAVANTLAASAAYWLGSAAEELSVTPSGEVGSIGVFAAHKDISQRLEADGERVTLIHAGRFKVDGNPFEPLSESARTATQERINEVYSEFVGAVAKHRETGADVVKNGFGEGRSVSARSALAEGMVDRIETLDEAIARIRGQRRSTSARARAIQFGGVA